MNDRELEIAAGELAAQAGYTMQGPLQSLAGGRNNRVFVIETTTRPLVLKQYFCDSESGWGRLEVEFAFARFAWEHGTRSLPEPIAMDGDRHLGLFAYVAARRLSAEDVTSQRVVEALDLFASLNAQRQSPAAAVLPPAAEACFSLAEHLATVDRRVARLQDRAGRDTGDEIDRQLHEFVAGRLRPCWANVQTQAAGEAAKMNLKRETPLPFEHRCLSPSDFGFHNAILTDDDQLVFCDFEYAGWDDPAKLVCDFFCQVQLPVPIEHWPAVVGRVVDALKLPGWHRERMGMLLPVYRIKWCCIMLNEFLQEGDRRRRFADSRSESNIARRRQLEQASQYLNSYL